MDCSGVAKLVPGVKEDSPMKRGLKYSNAATRILMTAVKEDSPMKRGLKSNGLHPPLRCVTALKRTPR